VEKRLPLDIGRLLETAMTLFAGKPDFTFVPADAAAFLYDRLRGLLRERGFSPNEIEAVVAQQPQRLDNISERLEAVQAFALLPQAQSLAAANKRITNILRKTAGEVAVGAVDPALFQEDAERALYAALGGIEGQVKTAFAAGDFTGTLKALASLRDPVDAFFNGVMVMADEPALRANRINLLSQLHGMMNQVADISKLAA
jgi:glycyl-tRNA synthetase beta chain